MLGQELLSLSEIEKLGSVCLAPAGVSSYKLLRILKDKYPDVNVSCLYDSFRADANTEPEIKKIDQIGESEKSTPVIVVIEREKIRHEIMTSLQTAGVKDIYWIGNTFQTEDEKDQSEDILYFFYDLTTNALNFEFITSLAHANAVRGEKGLKALHPVIVPAVQKSVLSLTQSITTKTPAQEQDNKLWFMHNVIAPAAALLPAANGITICATREEAQHLSTSVSHTFPENYTITSPVELSSHFPLKTERGFGQPLVGLDTSRLLVDKWLAKHGAAGKKCVVITLRQYEAHPGRNSDMEAWTCFAAEIEKRGYVPIFINDTYACFEEINGFLVFDEAALNLHIRMSIYEAAYINLAMNNGPVVLAVLNPKIRYLCFNYLSEDDYCGSKEYFEAAGEYIGYQHHWAGPFQKYVWGGGDSCESILKEFEAMCQLIEAPAPGKA